jgi:hypothetical protein
LFVELLQISQYLANSFAARFIAFSRSCLAAITGAAKTARFNLINIF